MLVGPSCHETFASLAYQRLAILHHLRRYGEPCPALSLLSQLLLRMWLVCFWNELGGDTPIPSSTKPTSLSEQATDSLQRTFEILGHPHFKLSGVSSKLSSLEERLLSHISSGFQGMLSGCGSVVTPGLSGSTHSQLRKASERT